jgi:hypothetical protein
LSANPRNAAAYASFCPVIWTGCRTPGILPLETIVMASPRAEKSIQIFAAYLVGMGLVLIFAPNLLFRLMRLPETREVWIRVVGMFALVLAYYYTRAASQHLTAFLQWTVHVRMSVIVFFIGFVALADAPPILIGFGAVDFAAALWTHLALGKDRADRHENPLP